MYYILSLVLIFICLYVIGISIFSLYILISSRFFQRPPLVITTGKTYTTIIKCISEKIEECENNTSSSVLTLIEAGSGIGTLLIPLAKKFPNHRFIGLEIAYFPYIISKLRTKNFENIRIYHKNLFNYDFKEANFVVAFLLNKTMLQFTDKCKKELIKPGYVFSNRFKLYNIEPEKTIDIGDRFSYIHIYKSSL